MSKLSLVVPCRDEASCVGPFVAAVVATPLECPWEIVFVDDGSIDATLEEIKALSHDDPRIRYVSFSRNFGKEAALYAGITHSTGDLIVTMDADLQHSPNLLPEMYRAIEDEGYDCVAACRVTRKGEPQLRSWFAHRFYALMSRYSEVRLKDGSMDYRMMTRQVAQAVLAMGERDRFTKGLYQWVGFRTKWLETSNVERQVGRTKWSFCSLFAYSIRGLLAFSTAPLQIATILSVLSIVLALADFIWLAVRRFALGAPIDGWMLAIGFILLIGGLQFMVIGILGLYVGGIFRESKQRPIFIVREKK